MQTTKRLSHHRDLVLVVMVTLIVFTASCKARSHAQPMSDAAVGAADVVKADKLYAERDNLLQLRQGIALVEQAHITDPDNYEAAWKLAKFNYYLATHSNDKNERDKAFRDGIAAGKDAVQLQNGKPEGHFWLGANYGGPAQSSILAGLSSVDDIRSEMETVIKLDQGYQNGSAYMVLGLVYLSAPGFAGGDPQKAVAEMEKGLPFGDGNAFLHLHLAEAYLKVGRKGDARRELEGIIKLTPDKDYIPEYNEAVTGAKKLLAETN
jgi:tetratricopeptide (TPR) repeat protein